MDEAYEFFAANGGNSVRLLQTQIGEAMAEGDEAKALHLDEILQAVEALASGSQTTDKGEV